MIYPAPISTNERVINLDSQRLLRFIIIIVCFFNALYIKDKEAKSKKDVNILRAAAGLTIIADWFFFSYNIDVGILIFAIIHTFYNYRYTQLIRVKIQVAASAVVFLIFFLIFKNITAGLLGAYFVSGFYSLTGSIMAKKEFPSPNNILIILGMVLFYVSSIIYLASALMSPQMSESVFKLIQITYLPAQVLLSSTGRKIEV